MMTRLESRENRFFSSYPTYARYLKWLTLSLFTYVVVAFVTKINWHTAFLATWVPSFHVSTDYLLILVALLGTTISPYLYFWQANQEVEEHRVNGRTHVDRDELR